MPEPPVDGPQRGSHRRAIAIAVGFVLGIAAVVAIATHPSAGQAGRPVPGATTAPPSTMPSLRPTAAPAVSRSVSIDFGIVTDPATDWSEVRDRLDSVGANTVNLNAGRVEFTAFDWPAHPEVAAEPGTDHIAVAAHELATTAAGGQRAANLIVDTYVPEWLKQNPELAGVNARGEASQYTASAAQLLEGQVGDRLEAYVAALGERYDPNAIEITELFFDSSVFGADDLALFRRMTGAADWPRKANGSIDTSATILGTWRSDVMAGIMTRLRTALDAVRGGEGSRIGLTLDVRVNWDDPAASRPLSGHDYATLLKTGVTLQPWAYIGRADRKPTDLPALTAGIASGGYDMSRFIVSIGLWRGETSGENLDRITPDELAVAVRGAETNGIRAVNVTPYSLMTADHWTALAKAWG